MNDFDFVGKMNDEETLLFKKSIRKLLDKTFILADKDERLYDFVSPESRQIDINRYLSLMGFKMVVEDRMKLAMLVIADEDAETPGLRSMGLYRFRNEEIRLLLTLWLLFLERMGYEEPVQVSVGDIIDKCRFYKIVLKPVDFRSAFQVFKRFSLIDFSNDVLTEDSPVRLYPSLSFAFDIAALKKVISEYTDSELSEDEEAEMAEENTEDEE